MKGRCPSIFWEQEFRNCIGTEHQCSQPNTFFQDFYAILLKVNMLCTRHDFTNIIIGKGEIFLQLFSSRIAAKGDFN